MLPSRHSEDLDAAWFAMKECPTCSQCYDDNFDRCTADGKQLNFSWPGPRVILDKYRIDAVMGKGGMGVVYRGTQIELQRQVAIKVLSPLFLTNNEAARRFRTEALAAARLDHPNIITIYDYGTLPGNNGAYLVMKQLRGHSLTKEILQSGQMALARILSIMHQVLDGIAKAHQGRIVHCDLKPDNIVLEPMENNQELVQIVDFGIARLRELSGTGTLYSINSGMGGGAMGTPSYMSPEQCLGEKIYLYSDIYSLGVILYEMLTGTVPFKSQNPADVALMHIRTEPLAPSKLRRDIGPDIDAVVLCALAKQPEQRFQSATQMYEALEQAVRKNQEWLVVTGQVRGRRAATTGEAQAVDAGSVSTGAHQTVSSYGQTMPLTGQAPKITGPSPASTKPLFSHARVLVVDDEITILNLVQEILADLGCKVITARDGDDAWRKLKAERPHIIICDIMMPTVDGWQLFFRYKTDGSLDDIPFIFMTARDSMEERVTALEQGVEDYWTKPFASQEVYIRVRRLLQRVCKQ